MGIPYNITGKLYVNQDKDINLVSIGEDRMRNCWFPNQKGRIFRSGKAKNHPGARVCHGQRGAIKELRLRQTKRAARKKDHKKYPFRKCTDYGFPVEYKLMSNPLFE
jgi:hypothetical protein